MAVEAAVRDDGVHVWVGDASSATQGTYQTMPIPVVSAVSIPSFPAFDPMSELWKD